MPKIDGLVKSAPGRHPGSRLSPGRGRRGPESLLFLDSGFRRNDRKECFSTSCEIIKVGKTKAGKTEYRSVGYTREIGLN
jgi:hypothetical protein